ncbi:tetratricopeptide repeat protein [Brevundimonas sp. DC300-4]|uniref:tetratricopeptide repeat protein n=1 Tax=Brevundimonas sp. DC300-4 TaxID=2804594 RepID=UPI003CF91B2F
MKSLLLTACALGVLALAHAATADPQTDEANRQRQMASMQAEAARNDQISADRSLAQQGATQDASRSSANSGASSSSSSSVSSGGSSGLGASGGYTDNGPHSVVDSYTIVIRTEETPSQMLARLAQEAAAGDTGAQYNLGRIYYTGFDDAPRDDARARGYFQQAAQAGHAPSQANYGYFLSEGIGGPPDPAEGARWLRMAADAGNSFGQAQYGLSLVITDAATSTRYLIPAADAGEVTAQAMLGTLYAMGEGVERDDAAAILYLKAASDQGESGSTGLLAGMYLTDRGGTEAEGYELLRRAAEAGDPDSQRNYGLSLVQGSGVPKDEVAGAAMVRRAAYAGNHSAQTLLGHLFYEGLGVPEANGDAIYWWNLAAEGGHEEAIGLMAQLRDGGDDLNQPVTQGMGPVADADGDSARTVARATPRPAEGRADATPAPTATVSSAIQGELTTSDTKLADDSFYDCQALQTQAGTIYPVTMRSDSFDAYVSAGTGECGGAAILSDDDGGGGTNAALDILGDGQTWFLRANSLAANATGSYTLEVGEGRRANFLVTGQPTRGDLSRFDPKLSDDSFYDCFAVQTTAGATYQVTMRSSDFDTYLGAGLGQCAASPRETDDDSGGGTDSALSFTGDGQIWFVRANSLGADTVGSYSLELSNEIRSRK